MAIVYKIEDDVNALSTQWDECVTLQHHLSKQKLAIVENSKLDNLSYKYVCIYEDEKLLGVAYFQIFDFNYTHINFKKENCVRTKILKLILPKRLPLLICGNLFRINQQGFYFTDKKNSTLIFDVINAVKKTMPKKPCGILLKDNEAAIANNLLTKHKYNFFSSDVTMEFHNRNWKSFEDYQKALSKKYRKRASKILENFAPIQIRELNEEKIINNSGKIEELYWNVVNKQTVKLGTVNATYFYNLKNTLQDKFQFNALYLNDDMVGFYTYIFYENEMETNYIGLNYDVNHTHNTYFALLFLGAKTMIEKEFKTLELGRTAKEAKANLGATTRQIYNYINVTNKLASVALQLILKRFNQEENDKELNRNPFK